MLCVTVLFAYSSLFSNVCSIEKLRMGLRGDKASYECN